MEPIKKRVRCRLVVEVNPEMRHWVEQQAASVGISYTSWILLQIVSLRVRMREATEAARKELRLPGELIEWLKEHPKLRALAEAGSALRASPEAGLAMKDA